MSRDTCARCPETSQRCPRWDSNPHCGPFKWPGFPGPVLPPTCERAASDAPEHPTWARIGHRPSSCQPDCRNVDLLTRQRESRSRWVMSRHAAVSYRPTHTPTSLVTSPQATPPSQLFRPVSPRDIASWSQIWSHAHQSQDDPSDSPAVAGAVGSRPRDGVT
jgi:hypothetical protein